MVILRQLGLMATLTAVAGLCACGTPEPAAVPGGARARANTRAGRAPAPIERDLDLVGMLSPVPEYEGTGRNLFAFGAVARPQSSAPVRARPSVGSGGPANTTQGRSTERRPAPRPSRLNVKYAGFVEKTGPSGIKSKFAIFLSGTEILTGAEGDNVSNFTVVEIGLESVTVSARGSNATERIPLSAN